MTAAAMLVLAAVGVSDPGVFFRLPGWGVSYGDPVTPLGSSSNGIRRLDVNAAHGMVATLDGVMERAVLPNLVEHAPLLYWPIPGAFKVPALPEWASHDWTNATWMSSGFGATARVPFPSAAERDLTGVGTMRIFPRVTEMLRRAAAFERDFVSDPGFGSGRWQANAGSSAFGTNDVISFGPMPYDAAENVATGFLATANIGFSSLPDFDGSSPGASYLRGSENTKNALANFFPAPQRPMLRPLADYQRGLAEGGGQSLPFGLMDATNRFSRISSAELGRLNTFLALFDTTWSSGLYPVYSNAAVNGSLTVSQRYRGAATLGDGGWEVRIEPDGDRDETASAGTNFFLTAGNCRAGLKDVSAETSGSIDGSTEIGLPKATFREIAGAGEDGEIRTFSLFRVENDAGRVTGFVISITKAGAADRTGFLAVSPSPQIPLSGAISVTARLSVEQAVGITPPAPFATADGVGASVASLNPAREVIRAGYLEGFDIQFAARCAYSGADGSAADIVLADAKSVDGDETRLDRAELELASRAVGLCADTARGRTGIQFGGDRPADVIAAAKMVCGAMDMGAEVRRISAAISKTAAAPFTKNGLAVVYRGGTALLIYERTGEEVGANDFDEYVIGAWTLGEGAEQITNEIPYTVGTASADVYLSHANRWRFRNIPMRPADKAEETP